MASLRFEIDRGRAGWRLQFYLFRKPKSIWLGTLTNDNKKGKRKLVDQDTGSEETSPTGGNRKGKRKAEAIAVHVVELIRAKEAGVEPDPASTLWANKQQGKLRDSLVRCELVDPPREEVATVASRELLAAFLDEYIAGRTDVKGSTQINYKQSRRLLVEFFTAEKPLASITPADADRFRRWLLARVVKQATETKPAETMAIATVSKHIKRAKTMFTHAVRDRLLSESPFADQKGGSEANKLRHFFVSRAMSARVLQACPDHDWRLIFALPRFAGFRCPSEVTGLRWSDIQWDENRIRIDSSKTGLRFCPIFPELRPLLLAAFDDATEQELMHNAFCVRNYRDAVNLSTGLKRILERAGVKPWPKTFINLRSTRRTELQEAFPSHVVDAWLGHSTKTAETHYLQVTPDHWAAGAATITGPMPAIADITAENGGCTGGVIDRVFEQSDTDTQSSTKVETRKNPVFLSNDDSGTRGLIRTVTPTGLEPVLPP